MTRDELQAKLSAKAVHPSLYCLDGLARRNECYCVVHEGNAWKVVYIERAEPSDIATGLTESQAYDFVYEQFRKSFKWTE
jgi:hypothetical protein